MIAGDAECKNVHIETYVSTVRVDPSEHREGFELYLLAAAADSWQA